MDRFEETKLRVKEATDVVALIESYLPLRPRGALLVALCPFHAENSPSFTVYRDKQFWKCYGCGKFGDAFTWLMERDGLTFRGAMEVLADRAGISLDGVFQRGGTESVGPDPYDALAAVADFFQRALLAKDTGQKARDYLEQRGLSDAIGPWRLGFHPAPGLLSRYAHDKQLPRDVLEQAGLLHSGREPFQHRLMFPIEDERGRIVGFGGRIVPGTPSAEADGDFKPPKYRNSPESPFFNKRRVLFGLHRAKQAGQRRIVVTEGYTDVIACHLGGFQGAVAALGTAFTQEHARMLERFATAGLILMFDGDRAGMQAAERASRELINSRLSIKMALMGDADGAAKDPADMVLARPGEDPELLTERRARFADVLDGAEEWLAVWFRLLGKRLDLSQAQNVEAAARECATLLQLVEAPVRQSALLQQMARHLAVPAPTLERLLQKLARPPRRADAETAAPAERPAAAAPLTPLQQAELDLLSCALARPAVLNDFDVEADGPKDADVATVVQWAIEGMLLGRSDGKALFRYLFARSAEQPALQALIVAANDLAERLKDPDAVFQGLLVGRRRLHGQDQQRRWRQQLQEAMRVGDTQQAATLQALLLDRLRQDRPRPPGRSSTNHPPPATAGHSTPGQPAEPPADS